jgi:hypothetical protein
MNLNTIFKVGIKHYTKLKMIKIKIYDLEIREKYKG